MSSGVKPWEMYPYKGERASNEERSSTTVASGTQNAVTYPDYTGSQWKEAYHALNIPLDNGEQLTPYQENAMKDYLYSKYRSPAGIEQVGSKDRTSAMQQKEMGFFDKLKDAVTGESRTTPEIQALPSIENLPELNDFSHPVKGLKAAFVSLTSSPEEATQALSANFPEMKFRYDQKGNVIAKSGIDGKEYAVSKPGLDTKDIIKGALTAALFAGTDGAASLGSRMATSALTQAGIEGAQSLSGGSFDPENIALAGSAETLPSIIKGATGAVKSGASSLSNVKNIEGLGSAIGNGFNGIKNSVSESVAPQLTTGQLGQELNNATSSLTSNGRQVALNQVIGQINPDKEVLESAKRLGIEDYLQPDQLTTNQAFKALSQSIKSMPGSRLSLLEKEGIHGIGDRADSLIKELGGATDFSSLDMNVKKNMRGTIDDLNSKATLLYDKLKSEISPKTPVDAENVLNFINMRADELGGINKLSPQERSIFRSLSSNPQNKQIPQYGLLDDIRKNLTAAKYKKQGPFKDATSGLIKKLESELMKDQYAAAEKAGAEDLFRSAQDTVRVRKGIEQDMQSIFGKKLDNSIVAPLSKGIQNLPKGDISDFVKLIKAIPEDMRKETVASGLNLAMKKNNVIDLSKFSDWYKGLKNNSQAYNSVMLNLPNGAAKRLEDLNIVSEAVNSTAKKFIDKGDIATAENIINNSNNMVGNIYNSSMKVLGYLPIPGRRAIRSIGDSLTLGNEGAMRKADDILSSQGFINLAKKVGTPEESMAIKRFSKDKTIRFFMDKLKEPSDQKSIERWLMNSLQGYENIKEEKNEHPSN